MRTHGFTLLEFLVVLAIIALIAGIFGTSLIRNIRAAELREATASVASDLRRARSLAQRGSVDQVISWGAGEVTTYLVNDRETPLLNNVRVSCISGCEDSVNSLTYTAPYGEVNRPQGYIFRFTSPMGNITPIDVKVVGITGKVIVTSGGS